MKKYLALMLALIFALSLSACGSGGDSEKAAEPTSAAQSNDDAEQATADANTEKNTSPDAVRTEFLSPAAFQAFIADYVDLSHYGTPTVEDDQFSCSLAYDYYPAYNTDSTARMLKNERIRLNGDMYIEPGMKTSDFIAQGWNFVREDFAKEKLDSMTESPAIIQFSNGGGSVIELGLENLTKKTVKYPDSTISAVQFDVRTTKTDDETSAYGSVVKTAPDFEIDGKINGSSTIKDVIDALGEPVSVYYSLTAYESRIAFQYNGYGEYSDQKVLGNMNAIQHLDFEFTCNGELAHVGYSF